MQIGVQFTGTLAPSEAQQWFTFGWQSDWDVSWMVVPTTAQPGSAHVQWDVATERAADNSITYWITVQNLTSDTFDFEARYAILNA